MLECKGITLLGYTQWRNFENIVDKAKEACKNVGENIVYHFADVSKTIPMPKGAENKKQNSQTYSFFINNRAGFQVSFLLLLGNR